MEKLGSYFCGLMGIIFSSGNNFLWVHRWRLPATARTQPPVASIPHGNTNLEIVWDGADYDSVRRIGI